MKRIDIVKRNYGQRIASTLPLLEGVSMARVLRQTFAAIEQFWSDYEDHESRYSIDLRVELQALILAPRRHSRAGKPSRDAMRAFVAALGAIYEHATGKRFGRHIVHVPDDSDEGSHQEEIVIPFLAVCVEAASFGKIKKDNMSYPAKIVQRAAKQLHMKPLL